MMDEQEMAAEFRRRMDAEILRVMLAGWPLGYDPGKGMPGTLRLVARDGRIIAPVTS